MIKEFAARRQNQNNSHLPVCVRSSAAKRQIKWLVEIWRHATQQSFGKSDTRSALPGVSFDKPYHRLTGTSDDYLFARLDSFNQL